DYLMSTPIRLCRFASTASGSDLEMEKSLSALGGVGISPAPPPASPSPCRSHGRTHAPARTRSTRAAARGPDASRSTLTHCHRVLGCVVVFSSTNPSKGPPLSLTLSPISYHQGIRAAERKSGMEGREKG
ncbi:hypothetical protein PENTCL1PPCAC_12903, partial [Pristionchus entomophagus]